MIKLSLTKRFTIFIYLLSESIYILFTSEITTYFLFVIDYYRKFSVSRRDTYLFVYRLNKIRKALSDRLDG